jgi:hypothetical protein
MFCLVAPVSITFTFLHYQKNEVRKTVNELIVSGINQAELVLLKFTKEDSASLLRWEHAMEFEFDGKMYDIVKTQNNGDTTSYWCRFDENETKINQQLNDLQLYALGNNTSHARNKKIITFLKSLFFSEYQIWRIITFEKEPIAYFQNSFIMFDYPTTAPPPEIN